MFAESRRQQDIMNFIRERLNQVAVLGRLRPARHVQRFECERYRRERGLQLKLVQGYNLPGACCK